MASEKECYKDKKKTAPIRIIGLTGCIGSGKSSVGRILEKLGCFRLDSDELSREIMVPGSNLLKQITSVFGNKILYPDGTLHRKMLGQIVFSDPEKLKKLESIVHPVLQNEALKRLETAEYPAVYEVPLLFQTGQHQFTDLNVVVICPTELRMQRVNKRDGLDEDSFNARLRNQAKEDWLISQGDVIIENDMDEKVLYEKVLNLYTDIISGNVKKLY
ncbi:MAG: dephospho-CoA kinase [Deltaproteobacteria bacterium]|nr:dephospho-CoA kinase [Deltaproteobacteria bacterium]